MKTIFIVRNNGIPGEEDPVAVFDDKDLVNGFIRRNPTVTGKYTIEEMELNPQYVASEQVPFRAMINPEGEEPPIIVMPIELFDEEQAASENEAVKIDEAFHISLYASNEVEAEQIAHERFRQLQEANVWQLMPDIADV